ncbi:MAG: hypothetical protein RRZ84_04475 [Romboutsia sp.]
MRWILVLIFLYLIPLILLFKNYKNLKRSCLYSCIYIVLATTIVISNIYISGLNKIEEAMYYQHYANEDRYKDELSSYKTSRDIENSKEMEENDNTLGKGKSEEYIEKEIEADIQLDYEKEKKIVRKDDEEIILDFKNKIYEIEKVALIPMRDCMPYTKNVAENLIKLSEIKTDLEYAKEMCRKVVSLYNEMEIPSLSNEKYTSVLDSSRNDLIKTYQLREKAMDSAIKLIETKNLKYIGKITEYLKLSDNHVASFKDRMSDLKEIIHDAK